ncbi:MAG: hypothetical protein ACTHN5_05625 [Phycisphaerae bacterium]
MTPKPHKLTTPIIVQVDDDGPHQLTPRFNANTDHECLLVIYPRPTFRQARIQLWMSIQMFATTIRRSTFTYFRRINCGHNAAYRQYPATPSDTNHRSSHNGHA